MNREQVEHVLRASAVIANETSFVVIGICPDIHDLAVSKCVAARDKDVDFVRVLLKERMVDAATLEQRIRLLDPTTYPVAALIAWARRRAAEANTTP